VGLGTVGAANTLARTTPMFTLVAGVAERRVPPAMALSGSSAIVRAVVSEYLFDQVWKIEHVLKGVSFTAADGFAYGITGNAVTATLRRRRRSPVIGSASSKRPSARPASWSTPGRRRSTAWRAT
jgi:hypothetical protein